MYAKMRNKGKEKSNRNGGNKKAESNKMAEEKSKK